MKSNTSSDIEGGRGEEGASPLQSMSWRSCFGLKKMVPRTRQKVLLMLCVAAGILDPLFFYIPTINGGSMCLKLDQKLGIILVALRSLVDVLHPVLWYIQWKATTGADATTSEVADGETPGSPNSSTGRRPTSAGNTKPSSTRTAVEILSILPLPQATTVAIIIMKGSHRLKQALMVLKCSVFSQFVLRALMVVPLCRKTIRNSPTLRKFRFWVGAGSNLMFFVLASHFVGAFWYLLSVGRTMDCWKSSCWSHGGCDLDSLYCSGPIGNKSYLNDRCSPEKTSNSPAFDFGIYLSALEFNIVSSTKFPLKLSYCFWWGLRNLSSLGQNLNTSAYEWELCFSICISIIGLILVSLFIGNMQAYFQFKTQGELEKMDKMEQKMATILAKKKEEKKKMDKILAEKKKMDKILAQKKKKMGKIMKRHRDLSNWEPFQWLPPTLKEDITKYVEDDWLDACGVDLQTALDCLPSEISRRIIQSLCSEMESRVKLFGALKESQKIESCVKSKAFPKGSLLFRKDYPVDEIVIVLSGKLEIHEEDTDGIVAQELRAWDIFSEELLREIITSSRMSQSLSSSSPSYLPSTADVKASTTVDAFVIKANDLWSLLKDVDLKSVLGSIPSNLSAQIKLQLCLPVLSKLPAMVQVEGPPLEALCKLATPVVFNEMSALLCDGSPINKMYVIVRGNLCSYNKKDGEAGKYSQICMRTFLGEELLQQALSAELSDNLTPLVSTESIRAMTKVEAFRIMASDVRKVRVEFRGRFYQHEKLERAAKTLQKAILQRAKQRQEKIG